MAQDENLRRITVSNDDGDVYVESSGDGSEIVLKTEKVRIRDGDVYCGTSTVGLSESIDTLKAKDDAVDVRMDTLNDTQADLRNDFDALETTNSGRLTSIDTTLSALASKDASLTSADAYLTSRVDDLNATDGQLKATDETLKTRISSLNATDAELKGVDDGLSSRIDALRDIYVNELNVTDKQLIVTDAKLGSRIDSLNATQYELKGADAGLSSRIDALESAHTEYERVDDQVASLIDALNATDAALLAADEAFTATDQSLSSRVDDLNATDGQLKATDETLQTHISSLNATDAGLRATDANLSSRIDVITDIYVNELNVTDVRLGNRIDALNATQYELKGIDTGLSSRIGVLETKHTEYDLVDAKVASLIDALNATDLTLKAKDSETTLRIDRVTPPTCAPPGGDKLYFNGTSWRCQCISRFWGGTSCDIRPPWVWRQRIGPVSAASWAMFENTSFTTIYEGEQKQFDFDVESDTILKSAHVTDFFAASTVYDINPTQSDWDLHILQSEYAAIGSNGAAFVDSGAVRGKGLSRVYKRDPDGTWRVKFELIGSYDNYRGTYITYGKAQAIGVTGSVRTFAVAKLVDAGCVNNGRCSDMDSELRIFTNTGTSSTWTELQSIVLSNWRSGFTTVRQYASIKMNDFSKARSGHYFMAVHIQDISSSETIILYKNEDPGSSATWSEVASWNYPVGPTSGRLTVSYSFSGHVFMKPSSVRTPHMVLRSASVRAVAPRVESVRAIASLSPLAPQAR